MNDNLSGWNDWSAAFDTWTDISISELQGLMTGLMVACEAPKMQEWMQVLHELSLSEPESRALQLLTDEAEDVVFQLKDKDDAYHYMPLVPDDEHELYERVLALKNWASGFITGIGIADCSLKQQEIDTIADLAKIAAIRITPEDEFAGGEESYLHLYEFARMVPVSLSTRKRKPIKQLPLIAGLPLTATTATEALTETSADTDDATQSHATNPALVIDAMQNRPS